MNDFAYCALCAALSTVGVALLANVSLFGIVFLLLALHLYYQKLAG